MLLAYFAARPRRLLLLDAGGAMVSALWLGVLLPALSPRVGLPTDLLHGLAGVAVLLCAAGSIGGWLAGPRRTLAGLAIGNASYAVATSVFLLIHRDALQWLGWIYFVLEIAILIWLVRLEWRVSRMSS